MPNDATTRSHGRPLGDDPAAPLRRAGSPQAGELLTEVARWQHRARRAESDRERERTLRRITIELLTRPLREAVEDSLCCIAGLLRMERGYVAIGWGCEVESWTYPSAVGLSEMGLPADLQPPLVEAYLARIHRGVAAEHPRAISASPVVATPSLGRIRSLRWEPLRVRNEIGLVGFDSSILEVDWSQPRTDLMVAFAEMLSAALGAARLRRRDSRRRRAMEKSV